APTVRASGASVPLTPTSASTPSDSIRERSMRGVEAGLSIDCQAPGSPQAELIAGLGRTPGRGGAERRQRRIEAVLPGRGREEGSDLRRVLALAPLAPTELRIADATAARVLDPGQNAVPAIGAVLLEPA